MGVARGQALNRLIQKRLRLCDQREYLFYNGKYHCTADLLFCLLVFSCFTRVELETDLLVWSNPN